MNTEFGDLPDKDITEKLTLLKRLRIIEAGKSPILTDTELALFILDELSRSTIKTVHDKCLERFGEKRTPSKSAIHRFWYKFREYFCKNV